MKKLFLIILVALLTNCVSARGMMDLKLMKKGDGTDFVWALYQIPSENRQRDLVLIIRNTGAKYIDLKGLKHTAFSFKDSSGKEIGIVNGTELDSIMYNKFIVVHLHVINEVSEKETYSFTMKPKKNAFVPVEIKTTGLKFKVVAEKPKKKKVYRSPGK